MTLRSNLQLISMCLLFSSSFGILGNKGACQYNMNHGIEIIESKIEGTWYLLSSSASYFFQSSEDKCNIIKFNSFAQNFLVENSILDKNYEIVRYFGISQFEQPGTLNINYSNYYQGLVQFQLIYMNNDSSLSVLVGCNNQTFLGSSDVLILSREPIPNLDEIEKASEEAERQQFNISDLVSKSTTGCNQLL